jgi:hypothetical protein
VGIGTKTPSHKLTVDYGHLCIKGAQHWGDPGDSAKLILGDAYNGVGSIYDQGLMVWTYGDGNHDIRLGAHDGSTCMIVDPVKGAAVNADSVLDGVSLYARQLSGPDQAAIQGDCRTFGPIGTAGGVGVKGAFEAQGVFGAGVLGQAGTTEDAGAIGVYGATEDASGYGVYYEGGLGGTGKVVTIVETKSYGHRELYAICGSANWCEDFGTASLMDGVATVTIDPVFAETMAADESYHVFLTPLGDCGLYVADKQPYNFVVKSRGQDTLGIAFDYRIVAKRKDLADQRLLSADKQVKRSAELRQTSGRH